MIEQGLNCADATIKEMTDFFETRVENLVPKKDKKKASVANQENPQEDQEKKTRRLQLQCCRVQ